MQPIQLDVAVLSSVTETKADGYLVLLPVAGEDEIALAKISSVVPNWLRDEFTKVAKKRKFECKAGASLSYDAADGSRRTVVLINNKATAFERLTLARKTLPAAAFDVKLTGLTIDVSGMGAELVNVVGEWVAAIAARLYKFPKYKGPSDKKSRKASDDDQLTVNFVVPKAQVAACEAIIERALNETTAGTNLVRWLARRAGNDLTCATYVEYVKRLSRERGWRMKFYGAAELKRLKAGAFLAVTSGSGHQDYGIAELTYTPKKAAKQTLALVGKGLVFDTGGHCLKGAAMLGMNGDMAGSAVALALLNVAALEQWPVKVTAYLAIADNMLGPKSYKPSDVVTSMKGTTIEIIDTDAEGRMVLADTLFLAGKTKPSLMMDFATLTGACVRAISTTYSGVFTNRDELHTDLIRAGRKTGERVWPFPIDKDFGECLESTAADIKQCREKGGVDHIEAAHFLHHFAGDDVPWVHVDLSAMDHVGGLAHVPTDETGFGVRFAAEFLRGHFKIS